jgi:hypothetical protein
MRPSLLVNRYTNSNALVCADWWELTFPPDLWVKQSKLFIAPSGVTAGHKVSVVLVADGSGSISYADVNFATTRRRSGSPAPWMTPLREGTTIS